MTEQEKAAIDSMSHFEQARLWRFAPAGHPYLARDELGDYFVKSFNDKGGWNPALSKAVGW